MKNTEIVDKIFKKHIDLILRLGKLNRKNPNIIALMLCELHFSSPFKRWLEYSAWCFLTLIKSQKRYYISVGISQIQIRHWIEHKFISDKANFKNLVQFFKTNRNYDLMESLFISYDFKELSNSNVIAIYRGEARAYHLSLFVEIKKRLSNHSS